VAATSPTNPRVIGRYAVYGAILPGLVGTVHYGCLLGAGGFSRTVAIKQVDPARTQDKNWVKALLETMRTATRIRHPNIVPTLDVVTQGGDVFLVTEFVTGETLQRLLAPLAQRGERIPPRIACGIVAGVLRGLHAAHDAKSGRGEPLGIVHGDVSPHEILVGLDGIPRLLDFGLAAVLGRRQGPRIRSIGYMAPEEIHGPGTRRSDVFSVGVVLWESLTGRPLFLGGSDYDVALRIRTMPVEPPSRYASGIPLELDAIVLCALQRDPARRYATAKDMLRDLETCLAGQAPSEIGMWVEKSAGLLLAARAEIVARIERDAAVDDAAVDEIVRSLAMSESEPMETRARAQPSLANDPSRPAAPNGRMKSVVPVLVYALVGFLVVAMVGMAAVFDRLLLPRSWRKPPPAPRAASSTALVRDAGRD
jgi:serine/threonine-protein kinase